MMNRYLQHTGVSQGSKLGSFLFLIYIDDIGRSIDESVISEERVIEQIVHLPHCPSLAHHSFESSIESLGRRITRLHMQVSGYRLPFCSQIKSNILLYQDDLWLYAVVDNVLDDLHNNYSFEESRYLFKIEYHKMLCNSFLFKEKNSFWAWLY